MTNSIRQAGETGIDQARPVNTSTESRHGLPGRPSYCRRGMLERFRAGDEAAFAEIGARYRPALFRTALTLLGDAHLAEEAVQDALLRAWRNASSFDSDREIAPWLYQIVRRCAFSVHRRVSRHPATVELLDTIPEPTTDSDVLDSVRHAVQNLEPDHRRVVELMYFEGLTQQEVADQLRVPIGTVKSRASRAHDRLGELLAQR
ncbi:sigma-70 family RNA polymerase sigma factor [Acrocarpospora macrocephala]|uniref:RNA polymerase sigma factor n=1 Tax=Acrocarpospora macrocephala TaxID=150177 RepID=A0A5M3WMG2_9ACTN|nr:RNA polymerase sigma factor [Acrocarpospora macrocephala]